MTNEHRRRTVRRWLCVCGSRFPCGPYLNRRDQNHHTQDGEQRPPQQLTGWTIQGGLR